MGERRSYHSAERVCDVAVVKVDAQVVAVGTGRGHIEVRHAVPHVRTRAIVEGRPVPVTIWNSDAFSVSETESK